MVAAGGRWLREPSLRPRVRSVDRPRWLACWPGWAPGRACSRWPVRTREYDFKSFIKRIVSGPTLRSRFDSCLAPAASARLRPLLGCVPFILTRIRCRITKIEGRPVIEMYVVLLQQVSSSGCRAAVGGRYAAALTRPVTATP
jgi:hypothetical protein